MDVWIHAHMHIDIRKRISTYTFKLVYIKVEYIYEVVRRELFLSSMTNTEKGKRHTPAHGGSVPN